MREDVVWPQALQLQVELNGVGDLLMVGAIKVEFEATEIYCGKVEIRSLEPAETLDDAVASATASAGGS